MSTHPELREKLDALQSMLVAHATGSWQDEAIYRQLRSELLADPVARKVLPEVVRGHRTLGQFWGFIQSKFATYKERRQYLWDQFNPALDAVEAVGSPADQSVATILAKFNSEHVHQVWGRALERRSEDPEGAITSARTLLEAVCKHILDESGADYQESWDLPKLYRPTADVLNLAPGQQSEEILKRIFSGCQTVVENLGALRNKLSDAHGRGKKLVKPEPRHAELAVNLAGAIATFLVETWEAQRKE